LEDVYGDLKGMAGVVTVVTVVVDLTVVTVVVDLTVVEYMKVKEAKDRNAVRNEVKEGKQERCITKRGYSWLLSTACALRTP
jgi:hypothetical protein